MNENVDCRSRVLEILELIADGQAQSRYQERVPYVDVAAELFNQWDESYYPDDAEFCSQFSSGELAAMNAFALLVVAIADATPQQLPSLDEFMKTAEWQRLAAGARLALASMNIRWRNGLTAPR